MSTCVFYVDESGDVRRHDIPVHKGQTPIFTLTAVALPLSEWREYDRDYLYLKRRFFQKEISDSSRRSEHWEVKGNDLCSPRNATSQRRREFSKWVLELCSRYEARAFAVTFRKNPADPAPATSLYTMGLQYLSERFSAFLAESERYRNGIIIVDKRAIKLDFQVAASHMSYLFGHDTGRGLTNILEAPLFADSRLTMGLQIADNLSSLIYANHYYYYCRNLPGAEDYSHVQGLWPSLKAFEFASRRLQDGRPTYGFRVIDQTEDRSPA